MLKRILLVLLCFVMIFCCFSCESKEEDKEKDSTQSNQASETEEATESESITETETKTEAGTETEPETEKETEKETESEAGTGTETETETGTETAPTTDGNAPIKMSGENRYKVIYAKDAPEAQVKRICNRLTAFDRDAEGDNYYTMSTDETAPDGSPEILVGLTNRPESLAAKEALPGYLDYSITVLENKIVIYANTEERIIDAISEFLSGLSKEDTGVFYTPSGKNNVNVYEDYAYPDFKIAGADIDDFSIVLPASASAEEEKLASSLQVWIAETSGSLLPIKKDTEPATKTEIIIGSANRPEASAYNDAFKDMIYYSISTQGTKLIFVAGTTGTYISAFSAFKAKAIELEGNLTSLNEYKSAETMTDKKAIFIGNSFIYWGNCVNFIPYSDGNEILDFEKRLKGEDNGYFAQVCKANGIDMTVYNFTYGGKDLAWIYDNKLTDETLTKEFFESIDYVFISEAGGGTKEFLNTMDKIMKLFPNAEEKVYLGHEFAFRTNDTNTIDALPTLSNQGVKIVAWGKLALDVHRGDVAVPGATLQYNKNSFIKKSSGAMPPNAAVTSLSGNGDDYHQNPLSGYITAQMCFTAISGCSAQGQSYDFCGDKTLGKQFDFDNFLECQYNNGETSNFIEIFNSEADMAGLQVLMDEYMIKYN